MNQETSHTELMQTVTDRLVGSRTWNRSQVQKFGRALLGPFFRTWGKDDSIVYLGLEKNGERTRLATGKAQEGKGAFKAAFLNLFVKPLEAKVKMMEEGRRMEDKTEAKAKKLFQQMKEQYQAVVDNPNAPEEDKVKAREALENAAKNEGLVIGVDLASGPDQTGEITCTVDSQGNTEVERKE